MLADGVDYTWCPRCTGKVDWLDGRFPSWTCDPCDLLVNTRIVPREECPNCSRPLVFISHPVDPDQVPVTGSLRGAGWAIFIVFLVVQALLALLDPPAFPYLAGALGLLWIGALVVFSRRLLISPEFRALVAYHPTRVVHAIEHATASVLGERGFSVARGQTRHGMFTLELEGAGEHYDAVGPINRLDSIITEATADAISRLRFGERELARDPGCVTSRDLAILLLALAIAGGGVLAIELGLAIPIAFAANAAATVVAQYLVAPMSRVAQRLISATRFASATVTRVDTRASADGSTLTAIVMIDVVPRSSEVDVVAPVPM